MTDLDLATSRRDITDALLTAFERRHEVLDAIVDAENRDEAVEAVAQLLDKSTLGAEAILGMSFFQLTKDERRKNQAELDDLNSALTFTLAERPASSGDTLELRPFDATADADLFTTRTEELQVAGDGSGSPAGDIADEIAKANERVHNEDAVWLVGIDGGEKVGFVFGELTGSEVDVRIWIHPDHRKKGYGTACLRKSRAEMAAYFPGAHMVVRAPSA
ncbi:GNAT family N-acetyltransferase [Gordonia sp. HNM0687]|uniref:GNAT family N-acetyltransferase n=1 Tax=Gordonia mangrovi TaxID=2665643 RepID=A0A6L7GJ53_9ACTN|nr:GNAT family N-acetyltransferase [Gordonia mangrovi]MXP19914.1 GNAT family N-acetyltransferase [Gordonia mangrovi]UVF79464.1 GNAT family N-acetyltransferase [Gordonia mangrovi]